MKKQKEPRHKLTDIDSELMMGYCSACDTLVKLLKDKKKNDIQHYRCKNRHRDTVNKTKAPYRQFKKTYCEDAECTATILYACQLTVDHVDGNRHNNDPYNLMTLCHNCHALKSFRSNDYVNKYN